MHLQLQRCRPVLSHCMHTMVQVSPSVGPYAPRHVLFAPQSHPPPASASYTLRSARAMGARPSDSAARADAAAMPTPGHFSTGSDCCAAARTTRRLLPAAAGRTHARLTLTLLHVAAYGGADRAGQGLDYALDWQMTVSRLLHSLAGFWRGCSRSYRSSDQPSVCAGVCGREPSIAASVCKP